jgi:hypothetical protein
MSRYADTPQSIGFSVAVGSSSCASQLEGNMKACNSFFTTKRQVLLHCTFRSPDQGTNPLIFSKSRRWLARIRYRFTPLSGPICLYCVVTGDQAEKVPRDVRGVDPPSCSIMQCTAAWQCVGELEKTIVRWYHFMLRFGNELRRSEIGSCNHVPVVSKNGYFQINVASHYALNSKWSQPRSLNEWRGS